LISVKETLTNQTHFDFMKTKLQSKKLSLIALCAIALGMSSSAIAQTYNWTGGSSNFYSASNWTSTQGPVVFDDSSFKTVRTNNSGTSPVINTVVAWQPGIFDSTGGNLTINADFNVFFNDMLNGTVTVNSGATFTCRNIMRVGRDGAGILNVNGTARCLNEGTFQAVFIGALGGNGTVNVNNGGLLSSGYQLEVGTRDYYPTGTLNVNAGAVAEAYWVTPVGPNGTINVNGGMVNTGQVFIVGDPYLDNAANVGNMGAVVGRVNLNSGTIIVNQNDLAEPAFVMHANSKMTIDNGSLVIKRTGVNFTSIVNGFVTGGQIVAAPGKQINVSYNGVLTTVTATATAGVNTVAKSNFTLYPNPAQDIVSISSANNFSGNLNVIVVDMLGKTVLQNQLSGVNGYQLNIGNLTPGMYVIKMNDGTSTFTSKIIKR
jgi:hypothetical protein